MRGCGRVWAWVWDTMRSKLLTRVLWDNASPPGTSLKIYYQYIRNLRRRELKQSPCLLEKYFLSVLSSGIQQWRKNPSRLFFFLFIIAVQIQLSPFPPYNSPMAHPSPPPILNPTPIWLCLCVLYTCSLTMLPLPPPLSPPLSPLVTVSLFFISMSLIIFCLLFSFVDYVPFKGEIIWYLSLTAWLISLSIMLSRPSNAMVKGRSSSFLSAV